MSPVIRQRLVVVLAAIVAGAAIGYLVGGWVGAGSYARELRPIVPAVQTVHRGALQNPPSVPRLTP